MNVFCRKSMPICTLLILPLLLPLFTFTSKCNSLTHAQSETVESWKSLSHTQTEYATLEEALPGTDVLYVTRIQRERFSSETEYQKVTAWLCWIFSKA
jgi:aspartate carbamoyltransferase catalytic subunit